jgi:hypothetical protein
MAASATFLLMKNMKFAGVYIIYIYIYEFSVFKMKNSSCLLVHKEASVDISNYIIWTFPF